MLSITAVKVRDQALVCILKWVEMITLFKMDLLSYKGNLRAFFACSHK